MSLADEEDCRDGDILQMIFDNLVYEGARCEDVSFPPKNCPKCTEAKFQLRHDCQQQEGEAHQVPALAPHIPLLRQSSDSSVEVRVK